MLGTGLRSVVAGYAAAVGVLAEKRHSSRWYEWLRLKGYVAFDLPRTVTALGGFLLMGIVAAHVYVLTIETTPVYFLIYCALLISGCLLAAGAMWFGSSRRMPQLGWLVGSLVSVVFLGCYLASRAASLQGLVAVTGRWDFAPGTFAAAFAAGFIAVHMSVLLGINVAYPQHQNWHD
jgi:hypothetical protein